jgi:2-polyprenyl-3-methyl-5-hydroxy-6-metoxy-1,4-benzoquinol methylase
MNSQSIKEEQYNTWHQSLDETKDRFQLLDEPWYRTVMRLVDDLNGKRVLEIGCGRGDFSIWMAERFPNAIITGTDFSPSAVEIAKKKAPASLPNLSFQVENAEQLNLNSNSFDYIISCETMEHVFHPQKMANEMQRVLKPGGMFILTTENYFNGMILSWIRTWITKKPFDSGSGVQPHENFFTFFKIKRFFAKAGLKLTHTESNHFQWLLIPRTSPSILCTEDFKSPFWKNFFKPFGRHYTFQGVK